jgi:DNA mismatch endonuclease, patch repair protein
MPDTLTLDQRRRCMQSIRSHDTEPEMIARRFLHRLGFRYRLHVAALPGKPDIVLPRYRTAIFVHGCFWHHHGCGLSVLPKTRLDYWIPKLASTRKRDLRSNRSLKREGWRVITIWECELKNFRALARRCRPLLLLKRSNRKTPSKSRKFQVV